MRRYNVRFTDQFNESWDGAVSVGVIDPVVDLHRLESLVAFLSIDPRYFDLLDAPGESVDLRWLPFISTGNVRLEIWYSVVEDDLAVYLESVEIIRPPQQIPS